MTENEHEAFCDGRCGSVAEYETVVEPRLNTDPLAPPRVRLRTAPQLSNTVGSEYATAALHSPGFVSEKTVLGQAGRVKRNRNNMQLLNT